VNRYYGESALLLASAGLLSALASLRIVWIIFVSIVLTALSLLFSRQADEKAYRATGIINASIAAKTARILATFAVIVLIAVYFQYTPLGKGHAN